MPEILGILSLSIIYGFTICSLVCLPTLGVYLMGTGVTFKDGLVGTAYFVCGKLLVYGTWGGLAAAFGMMFGVPSIDSRWVGFFVIITALAMPLASRGQKGCSCNGKRHQARRLPLLLLGASTGLIPCPALVAVLLLAAHNGSVLAGIGYGMVFGAGLIVSPLMAVGGSMALVAGVIRRKVFWIGPYLQGSAVLILLFMGLRIFFKV